MNARLGFTNTPHTLAACKPVKELCISRVVSATRPAVASVQFVSARRTGVACAQPDTGLVEIRALYDFMSMQPLDDEERGGLEAIAAVLDAPMATVKNMVFKKKGLLTLKPAELKEKIELIAKIVEVPYEQARQMVLIQPSMFFETEKQANTLKAGIRSICYELQAPKEEVVELILKHKSVLHGRSLHLNVADIAHLAILREPTGRIVSSDDS